MLGALDLVVRERGGQQDVGVRHRREHSAWNRRGDLLQARPRNEGALLDDFALPAAHAHEGRAVITQRPAVREVEGPQDRDDALERTPRRDEHMRARGREAVDPLEHARRRPRGGQDRAVDVERDQHLARRRRKVGGQGGRGLVEENLEGASDFPGGGDRQEALLAHRATGLRTSSPPR